MVVSRDSDDPDPTTVLPLQLWSLAEADEGDDESDGGQRQRARRHRRRRGAGGDNYVRERASRPRNYQFITCGCAVRDVWAHTDLPRQAAGFTAQQLGPRDSAFIVVTPSA